MSIPVITKVIRAGSECPEQGDLKALEHEVVCNNLGAKVENAHDVENTSPVYSEAGTIYCNPFHCAARSQRLSDPIPTLVQKIQA